MNLEKELCPQCGTTLNEPTSKDKQRIERFLSRLDMRKREIKVCPECGYVSHKK